jgi:protein-ribulosamine 3-kinase
MQSESNTHRLLVSDLRIPLEQCVTDHLGRAWSAEALRDMTDAASHPAGIVTDGSYAVFVKLGERSSSADEFEMEISGLRMLTDRSGALTPRAIGVVRVGDSSLLILEAVQIIERTPQYYRQMGRQLAIVHSVKGDRFGLEQHNYWGHLHQDNSPSSNWSEFFLERRLLPRLRAAEDSGHLPPELAAQIAQLCARLPELCGPEIRPTLLHGDAHQNNFISTIAGAVMIDPSVYFGHPEMDLAYIDFFSPISDDFFAGYREIGTVDAGYYQRKELWRIPAYLAMVELWDRKYLDQLNAVIRQYL